MKNCNVDVLYDSYLRAGKFLEFTNIKNKKPNQRL